MHHDDLGMLERGDMFFNRKKPNILIRIMLPILPIIFGFGKSERCKPDLYLEDGYDLSKYGFDAKVVEIPGHSKGSIGILTANGDFFCGDLLMKWLRLSNKRFDGWFIRISKMFSKVFSYNIVYF